MKTYKVKIAWEGVKVGEELIANEDGFILTAGDSVDEYTRRGRCIYSETIAILLHLGFIEEVGAVKEKFVPREGEIYYCITDIGKIYYTKNNTDHDKIKIGIGNCYRTEAEALEARERVLKAY